MPTFYNFRENGLDYSFDDIFVPADLFREGTLWAWGNGGNSGAHGNAQITDRSTPVTTFAGGTNWKQVGCGYRHTAVVKTDGTLWTWGNATLGELGNAQISTKSTPVTTFAGGTNWKQVSCGEYYTAAIKTDGTLWTWGNASLGQLGNATTTNRSTPVTTFAGGNNWKQVSGGGGHIVAIKTDGTLWTWGRNNSGQLGTNDTTTNRSTPVTTFAGGNNWKQVSGGQLHTAAIKTDGTLWSWGAGANGKLGNAQLTDRYTPVTTFAGGNNWKQVACGQYNITAIKTDGTLWVWGGGIRGVLGNGIITNASISTPITTFAGGTNWKQVFCTSAANPVIIAIKTDGTLWTWGYGSSGRLGNAQITDRSTPVTTFAGGTNWKQVSGGGRVSVAVTYDDPVI